MQLGSSHVMPLAIVLFLAFLAQHPIEKEVYCLVKSHSSDYAWQVYRLQGYQMKASHGSPCAISFTASPLAAFLQVCLHFSRYIPVDRQFRYSTTHAFFIDKGLVSLPAADDFSPRNSSASVASNMSSFTA